MDLPKWDIEIHCMSNPKNWLCYVTLNVSRMPTIRPDSHGRPMNHFNNKANTLGELVEQVNVGSNHLAHPNMNIYLVKS